MADYSQMWCFAFSWASKHRDALEAHNSQLEFKLHRLQFLSLLQAGDLRAALDYSKNLALYSTSFRKGNYRIICQLT